MGSISCCYVNSSIFNVLKGLYKYFKNDLILYFAKTTILQYYEKRMAIEIFHILIFILKPIDLPVFSLLYCSYA